ncbi:hypothetical protein GCM10009851_35080 [Herbiconiux moechotypicola]|uniref:YCII-related domain-containing protein n=1 Tax=Herbiconiux moechotypicola TaxID=637393 RepID=A0ABP5QXD2_9MICO
MEYSWTKDRESAVRAAYPRHRAHVDTLEGLWLIGLLNTENETDEPLVTRAMAVFTDDRSAAEFAENDPLFREGLATVTAETGWNPLDYGSGKERSL